MNNNSFLAQCKSIDPSAEVDRRKNLEAIKIRLIREEEQSIMLKNKKMRRPAVAAVLLAGVLSLSVAAYAAAPMVWRYFDTRVIQGEEFVTDFFIGEVDLPDGTTSVGGVMEFDREALEAAGGGVVIVEVDGEEWVYLDELHFDNLEDGLALLQLENLLLPNYLPEGFSFSRFTFPVNPNNHQYMLGIMPAAENAHIHFADEAGGTISLQISSIPDDITLGILDSQQGFKINGKAAVLSEGLLSDSQLAALEGVTLFEGDFFDETLSAIGGSSNNAMPYLKMLYNGVIYGLRTESQNVTAYDLVRMAVSME